MNAESEHAQFVMSRHPDARCVYMQDRQVFKVYYDIGDSRVPMSRECDTSTEAWKDAANLIKERDAERAERLQNQEAGT